MTFLPLTGIGQGGGFTKPEALKEPGVIGLASDLVHVAPEYQVLAKYLLGRVVVAGTIDHAIALARKFKYSLRIVTLDGELLSAGGSMTGGAFKNSSNLLGWKREIEELESVCKKAVSALENLEKALDMNEGILQEKRQELDQIKNDRHEASLKQNTMRINVSQLKGRRDEIRESSRDLVLENSQLEAQIKEIEENRAGVKKDAKELVRLNEAVNEEIERLTARIEADRKNHEESARALEGIRLEAANLKQKVDFVLENISRVEDEIETLSKELAELNTGSSGSGEAIQAKKLEIDHLKELIENAMEQKGILTTKAEEQSALKEMLSKQQKEFFGVFRIP